VTALTNAWPTNSLNKLIQPIYLVAKAFISIFNGAPGFIRVGHVSLNQIVRSTHCV